MKIYEIISKDKKEKYGFFCPACKMGHWFQTKGEGPHWTWNEDREKPTISPSVLAWADEFRCHSFVKDGKIKFLNDCSHDKKGQTMDLPDWEDE